MEGTVMIQSVMIMTTLVMKSEQYSKQSVMMIMTTLVMRSEQHAKLMEPPSRASMWRVGFPTPKNMDDNALYCGGFGTQFNQNGGRCGICGDPWHVYPRPHEAPHGIYATGIIVKTYKQGSIIPVVIDITANHQGYFIFKLCPNNDIWQDPSQDCFDQHILRTGKKGSLKYYIRDYKTGLRMLYVRLPPRVECDQCILQWTWVAGNNWGICANGTGALGCGDQEHFRACSDIRIIPTGPKKIYINKLAAFNKDTTFKLNEFEDYYDYMFAKDEEFDEFDYYQYETATKRIETKRWALAKKKKLLAKALKKLKQLIVLSKVDTEKKSSVPSDEMRQEVRRQDLILDDFLINGVGTSTVMPWWARTNSHGRKKRFTFISRRGYTI